MTVRITTVVDLADSPAVVGFSDDLSRSRCDGHPIKSFEEWGFFRTHSRSWTSVQPLTSSNFGYRGTLSDFEDHHWVHRLVSAVWDMYRRIWLDLLGSLCWRTVLPFVLTGIRGQDRKIWDWGPNRTRQTAVGEQPFGSRSVRRTGTMQSPNRGSRTPTHPILKNPSRFYPRQSFPKFDTCGRLQR